MIRVRSAQTRCNAHMEMKTDMRLPGNPYNIICRPRTRDGEMPNSHMLCRRFYTSSSPGTSTGWPVTYKKPNLLLESRNPHSQVAILELSPIQTNSYVVDLVPWCREYELAQLPWIIDGADQDATIFIDPLTILPTHSRIHQKGQAVLKDAFASSLRPGYDLRMPDFSHMMISELLHYYHSKHEAIVLCQQVVSRLERLLKEFYPRLEALTQSAHNKIHILSDNASNPSEKEIYSFYEGLLTNATTTTIADLPAFDGMLGVLNKLSDGFIDLSGYKHVPPYSEVPMAATYAKRINTIYERASLHVYGSEGAITTEETPEGKFQAYNTVRNCRYRYKGLLMKTAGMIRASAIYNSLKFFTNVWGYQIVDLNRPTLSNMVSTINKNNAEIGLLESFVFTVKVDLDHNDEAYSHLQSAFTSAAYGISDEAFGSCIDDVVAAVEQHGDAIKELYKQFTTCQASFLLLDPFGERIPGFETNPVDKAKLQVE